MRLCTGKSAAILLAAIGANGGVHAQSDWDVVLNGRAIHVGASHHWNEENWGFGVEREFDSASRWVKVFVANGFKDSLDKPSYMAGGGIKRRFHVHSDDFYLDFGVVGFLMTREDVKHNAPFPGLLPSMTVGGKRVAVNITYLPETMVDYVTKANLIDPALDGVFFIQLKLDARLFSFRGRRQMLAAAESQ